MNICLKCGGKYLLECRVCKVNERRRAYMKDHKEYQSRKNVEYYSKNKVRLSKLRLQKLGKVDRKKV